MAPTAQPPPLAEVLFASVDDLVVGWNAESTRTASDAVRRISITVAPLTDKPMALADSELLWSAVVAATHLTR